MLHFSNDEKSLNDLNAVLRDIDSFIFETKIKINSKKQEIGNVDLKCASTKF